MQLLKIELYMGSHQSEFGIDLIRMKRMEAMEVWLAHLPQYAPFLRLSQPETRLWREKRLVQSKLLLQGLHTLVAIIICGLARVW